MHTYYIIRIIIHNVYVYAYVYMHMRVYIYIYKHVYMCIYIYIYIYEDRVTGTIDIEAALLEGGKARGRGCYDIV